MIDGDLVLLDGRELPRRLRTDRRFRVYDAATGVPQDCPGDAIPGMGYGMPSLGCTTVWMLAVCDTGQDVRTGDRHGPDLRHDTEVTAATTALTDGTAAVVGGLLPVDNSGLTQR